MNTPTEPPQGKTARHRQLNLPFIKKVIVFWVGIFTAIGSALTGLGAQLAFSPMLTWMFGFGPDKALGASLRFAMVVAIAAVIGGTVGKAIAVGSLGLVLGYGFLLFLGATIGAALAARWTPHPQEYARRRLFQTVGVCVTLSVIIFVLRLRWFEEPFLAHWDSPLAMLGMGLLVGVLTQAMVLPTGLLLVPVLHFFGGLEAHQAILTALTVVALASALPAWSYTKQGLIDTMYGTASLLGGILGGLAGGLLLAKMPDKVAIILSAVVAMFFCGREIARLSLAQTTRTEG